MNNFRSNHSHRRNAIRTGDNGPISRFGLRGAGGVALMFASLAMAPPRVRAFSSPPPSISRTRPSSVSERRQRRPAFPHNGADDAVRLLVSLSSFDDDEGGGGGTAETEREAGSDVTTNSSARDDDDGEDGGMIDASLISTAGSVALFLAVSSVGLQFVGSMGVSLVQQLWIDVATVGGNLLHVFAAIASAGLGAIKFLMPVVGKVVADGASVAAPAVLEATQRAADAAAPVVAEAARGVADAAAPVVMEATQRVAESAAPVLDAAGRVVDDSIATPLRQAVDAGIVEPMQGAAATVGRAVDDSIVSPLQQAVDAGVVDPIQGAAGAMGRAVDDAQRAVPRLEPMELPSLPKLPEMPEGSVSVGNVKLF